MIVCANLTKNIQLNELFSQINSIGFKHIQFSFVHYGINYEKPFLDNTFIDKARQIKEDAKKHKLNFPVIHGWLPTNRDEAISTLAIYVKVKSILASKYLVIHPKDYGNLVSIIELLKKHKHKGLILIENAAEPSFKMGLKEINMVLKAGIDLCFDVCHALESGLNINKFLEVFDKHIKVIHLSDLDGIKRHIAIGTNVTELFVNKIPENMIVVFEHKAKTPNEFHDAYAESLKRFNHMFLHSS